LVIGVLPVRAKFSFSKQGTSNRRAPPGAQSFSIGQWGLTPKLNYFFEWIRQKQNSRHSELDSESPGEWLDTRRKLTNSSPAAARLHRVAQRFTSDHISQLNDAPQIQ